MKKLLLLTLLFTACASYESITLSTESTPLLVSLQPGATRVYAITADLESDAAANGVITEAALIVDVSALYENSRVRVENPGRLEGFSITPQTSSPVYVEPERTCGVECDRQRVVWLTNDGNLPLFFSIRAKADVSYEVPHEFELFGDEDRSAEDSALSLRRCTDPLCEDLAAGATTN